MTEETITAPPKPKKKRKVARRAPRAAAPKPADEQAYPGLSATSCARDCNANGCVISGGIYCGHPAKGGLQGGDLGNQAAVERLMKAKKQLAVSEAAKRHT